jgi:hypothetical protein
VTDVDRLEKLYLTFMLGSLALPSDSLQDLRRKFYGGIADGTISPVGPSFGGADYQANKYYGSNVVPGSVATPTALTLNQAIFTPMQIFRRHTFTSIACSVNTGAATEVLRLAIYNDGGGIPTTLKKEFGSTIDASTGGTKEIVENSVLDAGLYWLAMVAQVVATAVLDGRSGNMLPPFISFINLAQVPLNTGVYRQSGVSGAYPGTAAPDSQGSFTPAMALRG